MKYIKILLCVSILTTFSCETMASKQFYIENVSRMTSTEIEDIKNEIVNILKKYKMKDCSSESKVPKTLFFCREAPETNALGTDIGARIVGDTIVIDLSYWNPGENGSKAFIEVKDLIENQLSKKYKINISVYGKFIGYRN